MDKPQLVMRSPLFGLCNLIPQGAGTAPYGHTIGYVELEDAPEKLDVAIYDGEWRGRSLKPLRAPVARWYKVEKADGTPLF
jgi:hypothetical protein